MKGGYQKRDVAIKLLAQLDRSSRKEASGGAQPRINDGLAARLCYRNALHLYRSGYTLGGMGEFGSARSLMILSIEELAKALAYQMIHLGGFRTKGGRDRPIVWFDRQCFKCHICKQELIFRIRAGMLIGEAFNKLDQVKELFRDAETLEDALGKVPAALTGITGPELRAAFTTHATQHPTMWRELTGLFKDVRDFERSKQLGFYVEGWENPPLTPQQVSSAQYQEVQAFVRARLSELFPLLGQEVPREWRRLTRLLVERLGAAMQSADPSRNIPVILCKHIKHQLPRGFGS